MCNALSIITINLNDAAGLEKTIISVINQTYNKFQYIIVDGGSSDQSIEVIKKYQSRISYWVSEKDQGIYNGMNKGLNQANGQFCLFLNSGDYLQDDDILESIAFLFNDKYDIVYGDLVLDFGNKRSKKKYPAPFTLYDFANGSLPHPSSFIRTSLLKGLDGYDEDFRIVSDWIFFLRAFLDRKAMMRRIDKVISVHNMFGISGRPNKFGYEPDKAIAKYYPALAADFAYFKRLNYYELSRPHQFLKEVLGKAKRIIK